MAKNVGVAVEIASPSLSVQKLFLLFSAENVGVVVGIASKSVSVQKIFLLPVSTSGFVADI